MEDVVKTEDVLKLLQQKLTVLVNKPNKTDNEWKRLDSYHYAYVRLASPFWNGGDENCTKD